MHKDFGRCFLSKQRPIAVRTELCQTEGLEVETEPELNYTS